MKKILIVLSVLLNVNVFAQNTIPMNKGMTWHYAGYKQQYVNENFDTTVFVKYTSSIIDTFSVGKNKCAVFDRFINGNETSVNQETGDEQPVVLVKDTKGNYFYFSYMSKSEIIDVVKNNASTKWSEYGAENILQPALTKGKDFYRGDPENKTKNWHVWFVQNISEAEDDVRLVENAPAKYGKKYTIMYNTSPDTQKLEYVPGLGFTGYYSKHHGTTDFTKVWLVKIDAGK